MSNSSSSSRGMRAAVWALLAVSGAQTGCGSVRLIDSRSAPCVLSLSGGGTTTPSEEGQDDRNIKSAAQPLSSNEPRSRTAVAWSLPWLARGRLRARGKRTDSPKGRAAVPAADPAGKMTPEAAFSSALASFVGAMIVSGGTLGMWPQSVGASPFDPRPPPNSVRQPFFEGWFIRLVDHEQRLSFAVIFGSFRTRGQSELDQHYVSLSYLHEPKGGILPVEVEEEDPEEAAGGNYEGEGDANARSRQGRSSEIAKRFSRWIREQRLAVLRGVGTEGAEHGFGSPRGFPEKGSGVSEEEENNRGSFQQKAGGDGVGENGNDETTRGISEEDGEELESRTDVSARGGGEGDSGRESDSDRKVEGYGEEQQPPPAAMRESDNNSGDGGAAGDNAGSGLEQAGPEEFARERDPNADEWGFEGEARARAEKGDGWDGNSVQGADRDDDAVQNSQQDPRPLVTESEGEGPGAGTDTRGGGRPTPGVAGVGADGGNAGVLRSSLAKRGDEGGGRASSSTQDAAQGGFVKRPALSSRQPGKGPRVAETSRPAEEGEREEEGEEDSMRTWTYHAFPPAETVTILRGGEPVDSLPELADDPNFTWEADGIGYFTVDGDTGRLSFQLPELSVAASFRRRVPWSEGRPNVAGPEGWLQKTALLPLHYFVYSMGSEAGYSLKAADAPRAVVGRGSMHLEANYGESFPTGWVWAQGCSATEGLYGNMFQDGEPTDREPTDGDSGYSTRLKGGGGKGGGEGGDGESMETPARFVLTGGRFVIGPVTTNSFVMAFRSKDHSWNFRSTDLDRIKVKASRTENRLKIVARSWGGKRVLKADIHAPAGSFGSAIYVPTPGGFSNAPGCVESYAGTATFRLYTKGDKEDGDGVTRPLVLREEVEFKLAALEFGGDFQDT